MLVEFSVGNYRSFKDRVTFSMVASKIKSQDKSLDENNVVSAGDLELLRSAAVYGANASGKSNLCRALLFMKRTVLDSSKESQAEEPTGFVPFRLSTATHDQPGFFQIVFLVGGRRFRYGFEIDDNRVVSEWLYHVPTTREARLFLRDKQQITLGAEFQEGRGLQAKTRPNALFLSVVAQFNGELAETILRWFRGINIISGVSDRGYLHFTMDCLEKGKYREPILEFIRALDLSIADLETERSSESTDNLPDSMPEDLKSVLAKYGRRDATSIRILHRRFNQNNMPDSFLAFEYEDESEGTQKLIALAGPLIDTLALGNVLVIDEFDARMHPLISCEIVRLFNNVERNTKHAQLVFATHDTNLLNKKIFRRDQIWFTEKDREGATQLYSLVEFRVPDGKPVRNDASFDSDYIHGRYGAIPYLGDLTSLPFEDNA